MEAYIYIALWGRERERERNAYTNIQVVKRLVSKLKGLFSPFDLRENGTRKLSGNLMRGDWYNVVVLMLMMIHTHFRGL